jgi:hypothetical protein
MDFTAIDKRVDKEVEPKTPIKIPLRVLSEAEARKAVRPWTESAGFKTSGMVLFGKGAPPSWTVAVMSSLKSKVHEIKPGMLEWVLRTALPLRPDFGIWLNGKKLEPSKQGKGRLKKWILGKDMIQLPKPSPKDVSASEDTKLGESSEHRFGLDVPGLGRITGYAEAYKDLLTGKSDELGRSYGFFVYVLWSTRQRPGRPLWNFARRTPPRHVRPLPTGRPHGRPRPGTQVEPRGDQRRSAPCDRAGCAPRHI